MTKPINEKPEVQYFSGAAKSINFLDRNASASIEAKRVQSFKSFVVTIDLHMHSNASDGILPPAEVVRLCAGNGVKLMSLTDHDTMKGIEEARAEAERLGIAFVPGIEISTRWGQKSIHVAAYNLNPNTEAFKAFFKGVDKKHIERGERMGKLLAACGCKGAFEGAMALAVHPGSLSRTHFAQWLLDAGYVENYAQAFDKYLKPGKPGYVQIEWPEIRDAVRFVKSEGGTASLAHPGRYNLKEGWMIDELLTAFFLAASLCLEETDCYAIVPKATAELALDPRRTAMLQLSDAAPKLTVRLGWHERTHADPGSQLIRAQLLALIQKRFGRPAGE